MSGRAWLVGCGPGAADLLTVRALRVIAAADVLLHDSLVPEEILALARPGARRVRVGKRAGQGGTDVAYVARLVAREALAGNCVARLHGGDPSMFGRLAEELRILRQARVAVELVPGITSPLACAASLQVPLTGRGVAASVLLAAGSNEDAVRSAAREPSRTLAFYMAGRRAGAIARELVAAGRAAQTPAALVFNASRPDERVVRTTLAQLAADESPSPAGSDAAMLLVGEVLAEALARRSRNQCSCEDRGSPSPERSCSERVSPPVSDEIGPTGRGLGWGKRGKQYDPKASFLHHAAAFGRCVVKEIRRVMSNARTFVRPHPQPPPRRSAFSPTTESITGPAVHAPGRGLALAPRQRLFARSEESSLAARILTISSAGPRSADTTVREEVQAWISRFST